MPSSDYIPYSRRAGSVISHHRMWKASDHLLIVKELGCSEEYKRFYFHDIQALIIMRSSSYLLWALLFPVMALFCAGFMFSVENPGILQGFLVAFMLFWIVHLLRGPTCKCWIQTGINREQLGMFRRVSAANRFWKRIESELTSAQGSFSIEEMDAEGTRNEVDPKDIPPSVPTTSHNEAG